MFCSVGQLAGRGGAGAGGGGPGSGGAGPLHRFLCSLPLALAARAQCGGVYWYDVGGQWVGPTQKRFLAMAEEYGVKLYEATQCEFLVLDDNPHSGASRQQSLCWPASRRGQRRTRPGVGRRPQRALRLHLRLSGHHLRTLPDLAAAPPALPPGRVCAGKGRTRLYVDDKPLLVSSDLMVGLPVPEAELAQFTPAQARAGGSGGGHGGRRRGGPAPSPAAGLLPEMMLHGSSPIPPPHLLPLHPRPVAAPPAHLHTPLASCTAPNAQRASLSEYARLVAELKQVVETVDVREPWKTPNATELDATTFQSW